MFREWEMLRLRASDYKNHRIFTLRCFHKDLVPVSIRLKSTLNASKPRQIIRKAEKDLLQTRVKAINNILDQVTKQTEDCRTQLASIISAVRLTECQGFIDKVSETRFIKVKQRQLNKFNILINKKQGNITRANATIWSKNLVSQTNRQASASPQGKTTTHPKLTVRQALTLTSLRPQLILLPGKVAILSWQLLTFPWKEAVLPRPLLSFLLGKEAMLSQQLLTFPQKEAVPPRPLISFLPGKEATTPSQLLSFLLGKVAIPPRPLLYFLPGKEAVIPRQVNLTILLVQSGRAVGIPPGTGPSTLPRRTAPPPGKTPHHSTL